MRLFLAMTSNPKVTVNDLLTVEKDTFAFAALTIFSILCLL